MVLERPLVEPMPEAQPERFRIKDLTLREIEQLWMQVENPTKKDTDMWHELCDDIRETANRYTQARCSQEDTLRKGLRNMSREMIVAYDQSRRSAHNAFIANCHALARLARLNKIDDHWLRWGRSWLDTIDDDPDSREEFYDQAIKITAQTIREEEEKKYVTGHQSLAG